MEIRKWDNIFDKFPFSNVRFLSALQITTYGAPVSYINKPPPQIKGLSISLPLR